MPELNTERKIHIRMGEDLYKRLGIRSAELDTTIHDYVVELLATGIREAFDCGSGHDGLVVTAVCTRPDSDDRETDLPPPPAEGLSAPIRPESCA